MVLTESNYETNRRGSIEVICGSMFSGKTEELIRRLKRAKIARQRVEIFKPAIDVRYSEENIVSHDSTSILSTPVDNSHSILLMASGVDVVGIDEAQFLSARHVLDLTKIVDELKIPVMAFGLKNDFRNELFEGSKFLLLYADKIEEMKTICWFCHKKAIMNLRYVNHVPVYEGEQVQIGGNETYYPVCRQHYVNPKMKSN